MSVNTYVRPASQTAEAIVRVRAAESASRVIPVFVDAHAARRTVTGWVIGDVANMLRGDEPVLVVEAARAFWRVPVVLTSRAGVVGEVGAVEVDAQTGATDATDELAQRLIKQATQLVSIKRNNDTDAHINVASSTPDADR